MRTLQGLIESFAVNMPTRRTTAGGSRTLYYIGKRPARPVPGRHGPWKRPWLKEPVPVAVFLTDHPAEVWRIDAEGSKSIREGNLYVYSVPEWVIKAAGGLHRYEGDSQGVSLVKEVLITPDLWGEVTFKGSVPRSQFRKEVDDLPKPMARLTRGDPFLSIGGSQNWRDPDNAPPEWRWLLTTPRIEDAVRKMSERDKDALEKSILKFITKRRDKIMLSQNQTNGDEKKGQKERIHWLRLIDEAERALKLLRARPKGLPEEVEEAWEKVVRWPGPWVRANPEEVKIEFGSYTLLVHPWSPDQITSKIPPGEYGEVNPNAVLPRRPEDLLPYYEREKKQLGKAVKEKWIPLSPSTTGGKDYLQVSLYQVKKK